MAGEITRVEDTLQLRASSASVTVEWHSQFLQESAEWIGPALAKLHVFRRRVTAPKSPWVAVLTDQPLGSPIPLGPAQALITDQIYLQIRMCQANPAAPDSYDMTLVFRDQDQQLSLLRAGPFFAFKGLVDLTREYGFVVSTR